MNVFVTGSRDLSDRISRIIEAAPPRLQATAPALRLRLVAERDDADCFISVVEGAGSNSREVLQFRSALEAPNAESSPSAGERTLARLGADAVDEVEEFCAAILGVSRMLHQTCLERIVAGPFSHDVRGALSVVALSRQLLAAGVEAAPLSSKLSRVGSKISAALFDLEARTRCVSGDFPPLDSEGGVSAPTLGELEAWFADAHAGRSLALEDKARSQISLGPSWFLVALGGVLDGVARLTRGSVRVELLPHEGEATGNSERRSVVAVRVFAPEVFFIDKQKDALLDPQRWPFAAPELIPYRLGTAALLILASSGELEVDIESETLGISLRVP